MTTRTKLSCIYVWYPAPIDRLSGVNDRPFQLRVGELVRAIQPHGCPPNNTMRHSYVERASDHAFYGLVANGSLYSRYEWNRVRKLHPELKLPAADGASPVNT
jgi:hypothetical protein